jgi:WD40 repeat protein
MPMLQDTIPSELLHFLENAVLKFRQRPFNEGELFVLQGFWAGETYDEMVARSDGKYMKNYLQQSVGPKLLKLLGQELNLKLKKNNFRVILENRENLEIKLASTRVSNPVSKQKKSKEDMNERPMNYFEDALDVSEDVFVGRDDESQVLQNMIEDSVLKLTVVKGFPGVGKSSLVFSVSKDIEKEINPTGFDIVIFKSLKTPKNCIDFTKEILRDCFNHFDTSLESNESNLTEASFHTKKLVQYFSKFRCLLVIDNFDNALSDKDSLDFNSDLFYKDFIRDLASSGHRSHVVIACRSFPQSFINVELAGRPVRQIHLEGLSENSLRIILEKKKIFNITPENSKRLHELTAGLPLAMRIAISEILSIHSGDLSAYLRECKVSQSLRAKISDIFKNLPQGERELLNYISSYGRAVQFRELSNDLLDINLHENNEILKKNLDLLCEKSLVEINEKICYHAHPLIAEIAKEDLLLECLKEIKECKLDKIDSIIMIKSSADESDRRSQENFILKPLREHLLREYETLQNVSTQIHKCIKSLQLSNARKKHNSTGNLLNILSYLEIDLSGWEFSNLIFKHADFRNVGLKNTNFKDAEIFESCVLPDPLGCPDAVAFSPTENILAIGDADGNIRIWKFDGYEWSFQYNFSREHSGWIWSVTFSSDGHFLASGGGDSAVRIWRTNGKNKHSISQKLKINGSIQSLAFSPNFEIDIRKEAKGFVIAASDEGEIKAWSAKGFSEIKDIKSLADHKPIRVAVSPIIDNDRGILATATQNGDVHLWSFSSSKFNYEWSESVEKCKIFSLAFSPDGRYLSIGLENGKFVCMDVLLRETLVFSPDIKHTSDIWSTSFSRDNRLCVSAGFDGKIIIWNLVTRTNRELENIHSGKILGVSFNKLPSAMPGYLLISASDDQMVKSWLINNTDSSNPDEWKIRQNHLFKGLTGWIWQVNFNSTGGLLAAADDNGKVLLIKCFKQDDGKTCLEYHDTLLADKTRSWAVKFSPRDKILATGGSDKIIKLWDVETRKQIDILKGHDDSIRAITYSSDGIILASASADSSVLLWSLKGLEDQKDYSESGFTGEPFHCLKDHVEPIWTVVFGHDNKILATAGESGKIIVYQFGSKTTDEIINSFSLFQSSEENQITEEKITHFELVSHNGTIWTLAFDVDSSFLFSAGSDKKIRVWNLKNRECEHEFDGHNDQIHSLSISSNGDFLASVGNDAEIIIWDIKKRKMLKKIERKESNKKHSHWITTVAFHPQENSTLVTGSLDERIILHDFLDESVFSEIINKPFANSNITGMISPYKNRFLELGAYEQEKVLI